MGMEKAVRGGGLEAVSCNQAWWTGTEVGLTVETGLMPSTEA